MMSDEALGVPETHWPVHPVLSRARLSDHGDALEWPTATFEQLAVLREVTLARSADGLVAAMPARFNFDRFVDATVDEYDPAPQLGDGDDRQRFYTRVTGNGFHVVGVFTAITVEGRRRYFQWLTNSWVEIGQSGFLYVRDDLDTRFSEVEPAQLEEYQPGATTTPVGGEEERPAADAAPVPPASAVPPVPLASAVPPVPPASAPWPAAPSVRSAEAGIQRGIAVALATIAHRSQVDAGGAALIDHPARVAERFDAERDPVRHCAAWLHDILESSDLTERDLLDAGVLPEIVEVVSLLTVREGASADQLARLAGHPDALAVKLASLEDNSAPWRLRRLAGDVRARLEREHAEARADLDAAREPSQR